MRKESQLSKLLPGEKDEVQQLMISFLYVLFEATVSESKSKLKRLKTYSLADNFRPNIKLSFNKKPPEYLIFCWIHAISIQPKLMDAFAESLKVCRESGKPYNFKLRSKLGLNVVEYARTHNAHLVAYALELSGWGDLLASEHSPSKIPRGALARFVKGEKFNMLVAELVKLSLREREAAHLAKGEPSDGVLEKDDLKGWEIYPVLIEEDGDFKATRYTHAMLHAGVRARHAPSRSRLQLSEMGQAGWVLDDVFGDGNCFYHAIKAQLTLLDHPEQVKSHEELRLLVQGERYRDRECAEDHDILVLAKKLNVLVAIVDVRAAPEYRFIYYGQDRFGIDACSADREDFPETKAVLRLVFTGDHFLSVRVFPDPIFSLVPSGK